MSTSIEEVFNLNDDHQIFEFCKEYAFSNPEFAEILIQRFLPDKSLSSSDSIVEIEKEIERCFSHKFDKAMDKYRSTELDWHAIDDDSYRLILRGRYLLENGLVSDAIHLALGLLRKVGVGYAEDLVYQETDLDCLDFSTTDAVSLLEDVLKHEYITKKDVLNIANELDEIRVLEAYSGYYLCTFDALLKQIVSIKAIV